MTNILDSLAKKDTYWRTVAYKITGNRYQADELVQNMYLKIYRANPEKWNYSYVVLTIYNLFRDTKKANKYESEIEDNKTEDVTILDNYSYNSRELEILDKIDNLTEYEKDLLYLNYDYSTGKIAKQKNQCRIKTYRHLIKIRKKILGEDLTGYENKRLKWKR